jgi:hypothetical protein
MTSCTSGRSVVWTGMTAWSGGWSGRKAGFGGLSRNWSSLSRCQITSTRNPSTPRFSQKRMTSCMAARTAGLRQLRSGCAVRNAW